MIPRWKDRRFRIVLVLTLAGVMAFFALRTSPYLQYIPWLPRSVGVWADHHGIVRNTVAFFVLALAVYLLMGCRAWHVVALSGFATIVEVAQLGVRGRVFDWSDIGASIAGVLLAWPIGWALRRRFASR
jgi:hypothetical protein